MIILYIDIYRDGIKKLELERLNYNYNIILFL
jgi:hypothetical protein